MKGVSGNDAHVLIIIFLLIFAPFFVSALLWGIISIPVAIFFIIQYIKESRHEYKNVNEKGQNNNGNN